MEDGTQKLTPTSLMSKLEAINNLDLGPIKFKLNDKRDGLGWSLEKINQVEDWYKKFLFLNLKYPKLSIVPTKDIDEFWHFHILDTLKYKDDCQAVFGYFLHHFPYFGMRNEVDAENLKLAFNKTIELYSMEFGVSPIEQIGEQCANACTTPCEGGGDDPDGDDGGGGDDDRINNFLIRPSLVA